MSLSMCHIFERVCVIVKISFILGLDITSYVKKLVVIFMLLNYTADSKEVRLIKVSILKGS